MKTYEVIIVAFRSVTVEADDEEEAMRIAGERTDFSGWEHDETRVEEELKTEEAIERSKRHCNQFIGYEE